MTQFQSNRSLLMAFLLGAIGSHSVAVGAGLNTDVALSPPEGGTIFRLQWRYSKLSNDPTPMDRDVTLSINPLTIVHGLTADLAVLGTVPFVYREMEPAAGDDMEDADVGDIPLLFKYRFYQNDQLGVTTRWAVLGGVEFPSYDEDFSSESFDPIIGTVWTHQRRDWWVDWDVVYKFNTAGGPVGDDVLRGDTAASIRFLGGESEETGPWALYGIGELNALYITDGSTQMFLSPGIQFITPRWILEAGVQLPVHQDLKSSRLENDITTIFSLRTQF